ncbi:SpoIIIAH-like family protein [Falsibacillus albus]|uniref:SpoIIIAH-like family protein n=1 Tax=Falsibacillus albus TaxID=2478915 RepID=A0A3L7K7S0_9BACI|nr:SpoIIIAH-like family protein [Falsibacillus albus]RLQ98274.1 SpoIIIAH-like family protein [Falsibacillus albus]
MLLKKQTVWLLTMLSLVVVLSVYYVTSPETKTADLAAVDKGKKTSESASASNKKDMDVVTDAAGDEVFEALRLDEQDKRSELRQQLTEMVASPDLTAEEKNKAYEQMQQLTELETKEKVLESLIQSMGYKDALVRADGEKVLITVKANEQSKKAANQIIQKVGDEIGEMQKVSVTFEPEK